MLNSFAPKVNDKVLWGGSIFRLLGQNPKGVTIYMKPLFYDFKFDIVMLENFFFLNNSVGKKLKGLNFEPQMTNLLVLINFRQHLETFSQLKNEQTTTLKKVTL